MSQEVIPRECKDSKRDVGKDVEKDEIGMAEEVRRSLFCQNEDVMGKHE